MPRKPLPPQLRAAAFTVAQGRSLGLGQRRLRGPDLRRPFRGVRVGTGSPAAEAPGPEQDLRNRCAALSLVVPDDAVFSHVTAARLWPLPLPWPEADPALVAADSVTIAVQVGGKLRATLAMPPDAPADSVIAQAEADPAVARLLEGKRVVKRIHVPNRIVNFVVAG